MATRFTASQSNDVVDNRHGAQLTKHSPEQRPRFLWRSVCACAGTYPNPRGEPRLAMTSARSVPTRGLRCDWRTIRGHACLPLALCSLSEVNTETVRTHIMIDFRTGWCQYAQRAHTELRHESGTVDQVNQTCKSFCAVDTKPEIAIKSIEFIV